MCDPNAITAAQSSQIGTYSSIVGGISNVAGSVTNSINARRTATTNAQLADLQAADAISRGNDAVFKSQLRTAQLKGTQTATLAAHGVALDQGSALDILTSTDVMGAQDADTIRDNANKEAYGDKVQAANYRAQASAANPWSAGLSSLLSNGATVADRWYKYKTQTK